jgi:hypothetical protein
LPTASSTGAPASGSIKARFDGRRSADLRWLMRLFAWQLAALIDGLGSGELAVAGIFNMQLL